MKNILIGSIPAEVVRKPIKNVYIRVYPPDGRVVVSVPRRMSDKAIENFLKSKQDWVSKQHKRLKNIEQRRPKEFVNGEYHIYGGQKYLLKVIEGAKNISILLYDGSIIMNLDSDYDRETKEKIMDVWYRHAMKCKIPSLKEKWEHRMQLRVSEVRIRKMKTKWGSCNIKDRRIWLSLELAKYPDSILEFILVHEMVHLLERRHNRRFYELMDKFLPGWEERKKMISFNPD
ncbi:MAG: SprT family zinc-dependent metalloprotease [Bacteroidota bacterium]|nr:SprT family zinc-dependent metalloprotease [Bacteroidota bacterium]